MKEIIFIAAIVLVAAFLAYLCAKSIRKNYQRLSHPDNFVREADPIESEWAKIIDKQVVMEKFRPDIITPDHRICYILFFEMEDGTQKSLKVDETTYHRFSIRQTGVLLTQNSHMVDFTEAAV